MLTGLCCAPLSAGYTISWSGSTKASKRPFPRKSRYIIELDEDDVKINYVIRSCDTLFLSQRRDKHCMRYTLSLTYSIRLANEDRHSSMSQLIVNKITIKYLISKSHSSSNYQEQYICSPNWVHNLINRNPTILCSPKRTVQSTFNSSLLLN